MRAALLMLPLLLNACIGGGNDKPERRPSPSRDPGTRPITLTGPTPKETQQCFTALARANVRYSGLPDRDFGGGCVVQGAVQLLDIGVPVTGLKSMRCQLAEAFTGWVRHAVAPAAKQMLGSELQRVETFGTYSCRPVVGAGARAAGRLSEHASANAIDVSAFILKDGRRITVEKGWVSDDPRVREFLRTLRQSACRRFNTVLSPDYNQAHRDHFHFDMGRGPYCA